MTLKVAPNSDPEMPGVLMPKKVVHAVNYAESERHTGEWRVWTHCWKNFRAESSWVVSLADFKLLLGQDDRPVLCDDCRDEILRPPEATHKVEPRERAVRPPTSADLRDLVRAMDQLSNYLTRLLAGLADP